MSVQHAAATTSSADVADLVRLAAVESSGLLDTPLEDSFDRATRLVARLLRVPTSVVSIVTLDRQVLIGASGLGEPLATTRETPLSHSFCQYVVADDAPLIVEDARRDPRVAANPAVDELGVMAYLGVPMRDDAGQPLGAVCAIDHRPRTWETDDLAALEDIAASLRTELQLRRASRDLAVIAREQHTSQRRREEESGTAFRRLAENATDAIFVLRPDPEPHLEYVNGAIEVITGHPADAFLSDPTFAGSIVHPGDRVRFAAALHNHLDRPVELRYRHRDGSWRWIALITTLLTGEDGHLEAVQGAVRDIEHRKRAELALRAVLAQERDAAARLRRLNQMTSTFLTAISHELRTPLTAILGFADVLVARRAGLSEERQHHLLERLQANAHLLRRLLEDVLDINRLARGELAPTVQAVHLRSAVERVVEDGGFERHRIAVELPAVAVVADPGHVDRIVANLLGNSARHTPPGTLVTVSAHLDGDLIALIIEDEGPGIPDHLKRQVFDPFVHGPQAATAASPGTGLGLTLVRELTNLNGGRVELTDRPGGGTRIVVRLPHASTP